MTRVPASAIGCALLASLSWGFGISAVKQALDYLPPAHLLVVQLLFSAVAIGALALMQRVRWPQRRQAVVGGATGILEFGLGYGVGTIGLYLTTASNTALISTSEPFFVLVLAWIILREPLSPRMVACALAAAAGLVLVVAPDTTHARMSLLGGDMLLLFQYFCGGLYAILSRRAVADTDPLALCTLQFGSGCLFAAALVALASMLGLIGEWPSLSVAAVGWALLSGMLQFALPFWLHLVALRHMPASLFSFFLALVPVFGVAGAMLFLGERLTAIQIAGGVILLAALLPVTRQHAAHDVDAQPASR